MDNKLPRTENTKKKFNINQLLTERSKHESEDDHREVLVKKEKTIMVDLVDLVPSSHNFYHVDDSLKSSIETMGLIEPIIVTPRPDGKYDMISGHRRREACLALVQEGKMQFSVMQAIVKEKQDSAMSKLQIIFANRYREKTDWERMTEVIEAEPLISEVKKEYDIDGRVRDMLAELFNISSSQVGRFKATFNHLTWELMEEFSKGAIEGSVAYEASSLSNEGQQKAKAILIQNGKLTLSDVRELKAKEQLPGQISLDDAKVDEVKEDVAAEHEEYVEPEPVSEVSICYSCTEYETCNSKGCNVRTCNLYNNRAEANKTEEQRYSEEQDRIDKETQKRLQEMEDEEKMENLPSKNQREEKEFNVAVTEKQFNDIDTEKLKFLILKNAGYRVNKQIVIEEYKNGSCTGRTMTAMIDYIMKDCTGIEDKYCIIGFTVFFK